MLIREGSVFEVEKGYVDIEGSCVTLREDAGDTGFAKIVVSYCLKPGDKVRRISEGEYAVEY